MKRSAAFVPRHLLVGWPPGNPAARRSVTSVSVPKADVSARTLNYDRVREQSRGMIA